MTTRPPVAPPSESVPLGPRDDQPAILYSSIVFFFVIAVFWNLPVSFVRSESSRSAENTQRLQIIRAVINPLKVPRFSNVFH